MKGLENGVFEKLASFVADECAKRGIQGTFVAVDLRTPESASNIRWALIGMDSPLKLNRPGKQDSNSLITGLQKIGMVIAHRRNTGGETSIRGEVPWEGGHISGLGHFGYAFTGAEQEVDAELMRMVESYHFSLDFRQ